MKFNVTDIMFDFNDSQGSISNDEAIEAVDLSLGVWEADDEDDLIEEITTASGWCISSIDYEIQLS
jgi:hypothetical protein|tara:strand:- start:59 stop:256 length:198 start_codon:yes stop_codon:yes gene_type:complete